MPIVFIHGVNVRADADYFIDAELRDEYFRGLTSNDRDSIVVYNPYWGDVGVRFGWNLASLPSVRFEAFGADDDDNVLRGLVEEVAPDIAPALDGAVLAPLAQRSFVAAVDALWLSAMHVDKGINSRSLARLGERAAALAARDPQPAWATESSSDDDFVDNLLTNLDAEEFEAFGGPELGRRMKKAGRALAHAVSSVPSGAARRNLTPTATRFVGDVLQYLDTRGTAGTEGPIEKIVAKSLREADGTRSTQDRELIVVAHSMGGNIVYDILTYFAPEVRCDVLVTVGSQIALFEEMKKFRVSNPALPTAERPHVEKPLNVGRWINVFDRVDPFAFVAKPVFSGVEDYEFLSSARPLAAHTSYFGRPDFFNRLRARLGQDPR